MNSSLGLSNSERSYNFLEGVEDPLTRKPMLQAVTLAPCGHTFNEDTVVQCLALDKLCPIDKQIIAGYVPNYKVRSLAEDAGSLIIEDRELNPEAEAHLIKGKELADAGDFEQAIEVLEALKRYPRYEAAQAYLELYLNILARTSFKVKLQSPLSLADFKQSQEITKKQSSAKKDYITLLLDYSDDISIKNNPKLFKLLGNQVESLKNGEAEELNQIEKESYKWTKQLIVSGKLNNIARRELERLSSPTTSISYASNDASLQMNTIAVSSTRVEQVMTEEERLWLAKRVFGAKKWKKYFGDVGAEPPLPANIREILSAPCPIWLGKRVEETHKLVLVPATTNGTPLTLTSLEDFDCVPKFNYYSNELREQYGDNPSEKSHWILITRDVIPGSRGKTYQDQQKMVLLLGNGYEVPKMLQAAVCILTERVEEGYYLSRSKLATYTLCQEESREYPCFVGGGGYGFGGYPDAGLDIMEHGTYMRYVFYPLLRGVAALRIF